MSQSFPFLQAIQAFVTHLAPIFHKEHASAAELTESILGAVRASAAAADNALAGGLPTLRARVEGELMARHSRILEIAAPLCHPELLKHASVQAMLREHEAEAARLLQLEDLLPHLSRDALLVVLGGASTRDGRSDYMSTRRVAWLEASDDSEPEPTACAHDGTCCCNEAAAAEAAAPPAAEPAPSSETITSSSALERLGVL